MGHVPTQVYLVVREGSFVLTQIGIVAKKYVNVNNQQVKLNQFMVPNTICDGFSFVKLLDSLKDCNVLQNRLITRKHYTNISSKSDSYINEQSHNI